MFKNYFNTACRNIWRNKIFSLINVFGLAIGISAALVIFLIVSYEYGFDKFEKDGDSIYKVVLDANFNGTAGHSSAVPAPLATAVANEITGIEYTVPILTYQGDMNAAVAIPSHAANPLVFKKQGSVVYTNPEYFKMISYDWIAGSQQMALKEPYAVVLTKTRADQYFPGIPASEIIGKQIIYDKVITCKVTGIVNDLGTQTNFNGLEFISYATAKLPELKNNFMMDEWNDWMAYSGLYIKLAAGSSAIAIREKINALELKYNKSASMNSKNGFTLSLLPLADFHFSRDYPAMGQRTANSKTLVGLLTIGLFLLLLGCINFINLTTAQASQRFKEIGVRKTMGSSRLQLIIQFLGETLVVTILATLLSALMVPILLNMFKYFIPEGVSFHLIHQPAVILFLLILIVLVSMLSGIYPAFILSGYKPALVLKNQLFSNSGQSRKIWIRKTLTVTQFVIAQFLIIATLFVGKQINFSLHSDLGFNKDAVINFDQPRDTVAAHVPFLLQEIKKVPGVSLVASGFMAPADNGVSFTNISMVNDTGEVRPNTNIQFRMGNPEYISIYQLALLAGRNVRQSDTIREFLINETYAQALGFKDPSSALGKYLKWNGMQFPIVGVLKDFHDQGMQSKISALVFGGGNGGTMHIKLEPNTSKWPATIAGIQAVFKRLYPESDFNYRFLDDTIRNFYQSEQHTASLLNWATGLAILISCLGLLGLVMFTINTRGKEISIRKVLGASITNIISILSRDFLQLVMIAFIIAAPLAWWVIANWLNNFAYKTNLSWWVFALSGIVMVAIALLVLGIQTFKAAMANPVNRLRSE